MGFLHVENAGPAGELSVSVNGLPLSALTRFRDGDLLRAGDLIARFITTSSGHSVAEPETKYAASDVRDQLSRSPDLVAAAPSMRRLLAKVRKVAARESNVLLLGESGSGKEVIAQAIRTNGSRADRPFVAVNAAALPESVLESELFGHERGSFTGAAERRRGLFELASGGTLFLDEVGELPLAMQAKLLRVLETGDIRRIGGNETIHVDVRLIAATNRELRREAIEGRFREDLYYRLAVVELRIPPLRERPDDLAPLVEHLLRTLARPGAPAVRIEADALEALRGYSFPGNVRELRNVLEYAINFCDDEIIRPQDLPPLVTRSAPTPSGQFPTLAEVERRHIEAALFQSQWNKTQAASLLAISRRTLYEKIESYGLKPVVSLDEVVPSAAAATA